MQNNTPSKGALLGKISHVVAQFNEKASSIAIIKQMTQNCLERTKRAKTKIQFSLMNPQIHTHMHTHSKHKDSLLCLSAI